MICYHTLHSLNIKIIKKLHLTVQKGAGCCMYHVTSSAASADGAVKLTTDSYQFWVAHLNLRVTFQSHKRFARKVQKYGHAFSKFSSICDLLLCLFLCVFAFVSLSLGARLSSEIVAFLSYSPILFSFILKNVNSDYSCRIVPTF